MNHVTCTKCGASFGVPDEALVADRISCGVCLAEFDPWVPVNPAASEPCVDDMVDAEPPDYDLTESDEDVGEL